jgi:hypothetical protein
VTRPGGMSTLGLLLPRLGRSATAIAVLLIAGLIVSLFTLTRATLVIAPELGRVRLAGMTRTVGSRGPTIRRRGLAVDCVVDVEGQGTRRHSRGALG